MLGGGSCMSGEVAEIASYPRHREARSAVAIQGRAAGVSRAALDRHASLAMTGERVTDLLRSLATPSREKTTYDFSIGQLSSPIGRAASSAGVVATSL